MSPIKKTAQAVARAVRKARSNKRAKHKIQMEKYMRFPWSGKARRSRAFRRYLDSKGLITPNFSWAAMACHDTARTPVPGSLRANSIRHCWNLEKLRHALGDIPVRIDGPYRTRAHNTEVGGASDSRHMYGDATDHYATTVDGWIRASKKVRSRGQVLAVCDKIFANGGMGNENSGTLHLDSRGYRARFVTWVASR